MTVQEGSVQASSGSVRRFRNLYSGNWTLWLASAGLLLLLCLALFANSLPLRDPLALETGDRLKPPSAQYLGGTDEYGRDVLSRTVFASRVSLGVATVSVLIGLIAGMTIGIAAAYMGGAGDMTLMRGMDLLFSFPAILLAIIFVVTLGPSNLNTAVAIGIIFTPGFSRVARAVTQSMLNERFIDYARAIGTPPLRIITHEVLPNIWPPLLIQACVAMGYAIVLEGALSFIGLGVQQPQPSWGNMIDEGRGFLARAPWIVFVPSIALFLAVVSINLLADALRNEYEAALHRR